MLLQGLDMIKRLADPEFTAEDEYKECDEKWLERMLACAPDPKAFQAGNMQACVQIMEKYFRVMGNQSRNAAKVKWFKEGVKFNFMGWDHHAHVNHPNVSRKKRQSGTCLREQLEREQ